MAIVSTVKTISPKWGICTPNLAQKLVHLDNKTFLLDFTPNWAQKLVNLFLRIYSIFCEIFYSSRVLQWNKSGNDQKFVKPLFGANVGQFYPRFGSNLCTSFLWKPRWGFFKILHNDRALYVIKGDNSGYLERTLFGLKMGHFLSRIGPKNFVPHVLRIQIINHGDWAL